MVYSNSRYILLDEPFNGVAPKNIEDIKSRIREQSKMKGIILTDHDSRNIIDVSDRIIFYMMEVPKKLRVWMNLNTGVMSLKSIKLCQLSSTVLPTKYFQNIIEYCVYIEVVRNANIPRKQFKNKPI